MNGFHQGCEEMLLFDGLVVMSCGAYAAAIVVVFLAAACRSWLVATRRRMRAGFAAAAKVGAAAPRLAVRGGAPGLLDDFDGPAVNAASLSWSKPAVRRPRGCSGTGAWRNALDALLALVASTIGGANMLILMTFNYGLFFAVIVGEVAGMLLFDPAVPYCGEDGPLESELTGEGCCH